MKIKIEKGIPVPTKFGYPFDQMGYGDSFTVSSEVERGYVLLHANKYRKLVDSSFKILTRKEGSGWRIWRIKNEATNQVI